VADLLERLSGRLADRRIVVAKRFAQSGNGLSGRRAEQPQRQGVRVEDPGERRGGSRRPRRVVSLEKLNEYWGGFDGIGADRSKHFNGPIADSRVVAFQNSNQSRNGFAGGRAYAFQGNESFDLDSETGIIEGGGERAHGRSGQRSEFTERVRSAGPLSGRFRFQLFLQTGKIGILR